MKTVQVTATGITPILMERMSDEVLESLRTGNRLPRKNKKPEEEAKEKLYLSNGKDDSYTIPAYCFWACLVQAGTLVAYKGKRNLSNADESLLGGILRIKEEFLPFTNGEGWKVDKRRGRLDNGTAVCIVRPRFDKWGFSATLHIDDKEVDVEKIKELIEKAGKFKGLGGHRKKGFFGRFEVTEWKVMGDEKKVRN